MNKKRILKKPTIKSQLHLTINNSRQRIPLMKCNIREQKVTKCVAFNSRLINKHHVLRSHIKEIIYYAF